MTPTERDRRRIQRPLRDLTDDEVVAVVRLARLLPLLAPEIRGPLDAVVEFAQHEENERDYEEREAARR